MKYNFLRFPGGKPKAFTLSYDDGSEHDVRMLETFDRYGLKCTFNLIGDNIDREIGITKAFIKEKILGGGHDIATHGYFHRAQDTLRPMEGIVDTLECRKTLEKEFGIIVRGMAFPDRAVNMFIKPGVYENIKSYLKELDITFVRTAGRDNDKFELPDEWHNWFATAHHDNPEVMKYIDKFVNLDMSDLYIASRGPKLFLLWGHSFEFDHKNNWEHLEEICSAISGRDDVWYATNTEIYNYVQAYKSLVYSADNTMVYNPTLYDIWFDIDDKLYCVKSGETIVL